MPYFKLTLKGLLSQTFKLQNINNRYIYEYISLDCKLLLLLN